MMHPIVQKVLDERSSKKSVENQAIDQSMRDAGERDKLFTMLALSVDHLVKEIQDSVLKTEVVNHTEVQTIAGSVQIDRAYVLESILNRLLEATYNNKLVLPEVQPVSGLIQVSNFPDEKEIKIPEYPKQIKSDVVSLPKYVGEKLDDLKKAILSIPSPIVNVPQQLPPQVNVDLKEVVSHLARVTDLLTSLNSYEEKEEPLDLSPLISSVGSVQEAIESIRFPIPNFQSSWQHSRNMQSLDAAQTIHNTTISTPAALDLLTTHRAVDYIEVILGDGVFRQTFTYNTYGEVTDKTTWIKQ